jgi:hypothetical protein
MHVRKCPTCDKKIKHKSDWHGKNAEKEKRECQSCCKKGRTLSDSHKNAISKSNKETKNSENWVHPLKDKTYEEYYGSNKSKEIKSKISKGNQGKTVSLKGRKNISRSKRGPKNPMYGNHQPKTEKHKRKIRISCIETMKNRHGDGFFPNYNPKACKVIEEYGEKHDYDFQHAENGGEYHIETLGYWVDGYDEENNVVIEYHEPWHQKTKYQKKDLIRRREIIDELDCKFIIISEFTNEINVYNS